jgi:hypothetical protein
MTGRESVEQKAAMYLTEGRIVVTRVLGDTVDTVCQGTAGSYELGHRPGRGMVLFLRTTRRRLQPLQ